MAVLTIKNLDLIRSEDNLTLIKDVSLNIDAGEVVLLSGRNGIGKTTFIDALTNNLGSDRTGHSFFSGQFEISKIIFLSFLLMYSKHCLMAAPSPRKRQKTM